MSVDKTKYFIGIFTITTLFSFKRQTIWQSFYDFSSEFMSLALNESILIATVTGRTATSTQYHFHTEKTTLPFNL